METQSNMSDFENSENKEVETEKVEAAKDKTNVGIGTKDTVSLKPVNVKIAGTMVKMQQTREGKDVGDKVICICKHPDKEETIEISSVKYEKNNRIKVSGLWFQLDEDKLLVKNSALATFLRFVGVATISELEGKEVLTAIDEKSYLCFKAY